MAQTGIQITPQIFLAYSELHEEFIQSSGPGGQNVNKVATTVRLRFDVQGSPSLAEDVRQRLLRLGGKRVNERGELIIEARHHRTQEQNRQEAVQRLVRLIRQAAEKPKPRHKTRPTQASIERRLAQKKRLGEIKRLRRHGPDEGV